MTLAEFWDNPKKLAIHIPYEAENITSTFYRASAMIGKCWKYECYSNDIKNSVYYCNDGNQYTYNECITNNIEIYSPSDIEI